jgi:hypothetical protein
MVTRFMCRSAALTAALAGIYVAVIRPWHLRWGATDREVQRTMPGDDLVPHPHLVATRAVTVNAPAAGIWPWLIQMGYRRAGWYSYDWIDNDGVRVETIIPALQHLQVGDVMLTDASGGFRVEAIDPERSLVLAIRDADAVVSCAMMLVPLDLLHTRLIFRLRLRATRSPRGLGFFLLMDAGDFVMMRKQLLGIKQRAEATGQVCQPHNL